MIKRQKLIGIVASVLLAGIGTALLIAFVQGAEDRALEGEEAVNVLVVNDTIPKGTKAEEIGDGRVRLERVPAKVMAAGATSNMGTLAGKVTVADLLPGEQVVQGRFATPAEAGKFDVPPGMLQVTVSLDPVRAIGGQVRDGDTVGVLVSFDEPETTHLFLQKVRVTNVRTAGVSVISKAEDDAPTGALFVTMALDAPSVEKVVFAAEHGRLWLSLQPMDANEGGTKVQNKAGVNV
jgi:pilus assembly protein CpaB